MQEFTRGRYRARWASSDADRDAAAALRHLAFRGTEGRDCDEYDEVCIQILIEDTQTDQLVACFRIMTLGSGSDISQSYSAQFYNLESLKAFQGPIVEMGRFCMHPDVHDPDILRIAWGALTAYVDQHGVQLLFGCSSFRGTEASDYLDAFTVLRQRHLAPRRWLPRVKAPQVFRFARLLRRTPDLKLAQLKMPPHLRTYLLMGGWVSDHAVVDRHMNTLHVFTGLEIATIPEARKRLLRAVAS